MLTNLDWLSPGKTFPPPVEKDRISRYETNEKLFLTKHAEVWKDDFEKLALVSRKTRKDIETVVNYQQLLSKKIADFVCGETPTIKFADNVASDEIIKLLVRQGFFTRLYEAFIDVTICGNAVLKFVDKQITAASPRNWYPIVSPSDLKTITHHVIAYKTAPNEKGKMTELYVEIHTVGNMEQRTYNFDEDKREIGSMKQDPTTINTGLDDFAVQILTNITYSGDIFGIDDYSAVNSIIKKIMWRLLCSDTVLDKHSEPSMSGPRSALTYDEEFKRYYLDLGNYFMRNNKEDPPLEYVTWDGNLENNFKEIELLFNQLYILSEMGQAFVEGGGGGNASSGTALRLKMVSPRIKAARLSNLNTGSVKQIICLFGTINGYAIDYDSISLEWKDGLPNDDTEQTTMLLNAAGGKQIMSQRSAIMARGLSEADAEAELEQIREESAANMPITLSVVDKNTTNPVTDDESTGTE